MNKRRFIVSLIALLVAALVLPTSVRADTTEIQSDGETVLGRLSSADECSLTNAFVYASNRRILNPPSSKQFTSVISISLSRYDRCTDQFTLRAFGDFSLADHDLQVNGSVKKASLDTTIPVYEQICGCNVNVTYHLNWAGDETSQSSTNIHYEDPSGWTINITDKGESNMAAAVSGSITINGGIFGGQTGTGRIFRGLNHAVLITP